MQKKPLRILMITDFFPPTVGGIESHVAMLSNQLSTHGHKVVVATIKQDNFEGSEKQCGIEIYRLKSFFHNLRFTYLDSKKKYHPPFKDPYVSEELEKLILDFKPDIIHSHGSIIFSYMPIHRKNKIPLVATLHNYSFICPRQDFFYMTKQVCDLPFTKKCYDCTTRQFGLLKSIFTTYAIRKNRKYLQEIDAFLAVSNFVRDVHINHLKLPASKVFRIPNFFDVKEHSEINYENELPGDFILYIGALVPHKGLDFLVDAIFNEKFGIPIVILGPKHVAYDYSKYSDLNRIVVLENPPRSLVLAALARCRFLVVPSLCADACPLVVLEAMKHAKAVIASRIGGIPDIILEGETGLLIPPGDVPSLIKSMKWMLENKNICEKMGDRGRQQFLQNFTAEKITQKIEKIYLNVIGA